MIHDLARQNTDQQLLVLDLPRVRIHQQIVLVRSELQELRIGQAEVNPRAAP